jgi:negative regulator of sigma E activity
VSFANNPFIDYEKWEIPTKIDFEAVVGEEKWQQHWDNWQLVIDTMKTQ